VSLLKAPCLHCGGTHDERAKRCPTTVRALGGDARLIGQLIDKRYRIVRLLGEGAFGAAYKAEHVTLGRPVSLRVLPAALIGSPMMLNRFFREARLMSSVASPRMQPLLDAGLSAEGVAYVAYAYARGRSLASALFRDAPFSQMQAATVACDLLEALEAIHQSGFVHRALGPESVLLQPSATHGLERALLTNFGGSALEVERFKKDPLGAAREAATLPVPLVPPAYVPPERDRDAPPDPREDVFAAGVVLSACLSPGGLPRFSSDLIAAGASPAFEAIVARATAHAPASRFESAGAMRAALLPWAHADTEESASATKTHVSDIRALGRREQTLAGLVEGAARLAAVATVDAPTVDGPLAEMVIRALAASAVGGWPEVQRRIPGLVPLALDAEGRAPLRVLTAALEEADALAGTHDRLLCSLVGQRVADDRMMALLAEEHGRLTPELFLDEGARRLAVRLGGGTARTTNVGRGYGRLELRDRAEPRLALCACLTGLFGEVLTRLGARDVELNKTACEGVGDAACIFTATWM